MGRAKNRSFCGAASHCLDLAGFSIFGSQYRMRTFMVRNVDGRDWHRIARRCAGTSGRCSVTGQKLVHPKASASRSVRYPSGDHTRPHRFSRACHDSRNGRTTIPENTSFEWTNDCGMGVTDLARQPVVGAVCAAVGGSACSCVFEAGSDSEDRSSNVCYVGDTR